MEKYFIEIEDWLAKKPSDEDNVPLIIEADEGVGKKTLLVKWIHYHLKANSKVNSNFHLPKRTTRILSYHILPLPEETTRITSTPFIVS